MSQHITINLFERYAGEKRVTLHKGAQILDVRMSLWGSEVHPELVALEDPEQSIEFAYLNVYLKDDDLPDDTGTYIGSYEDAVVYFVFDSGRRAPAG